MTIQINTGYRGRDLARGVLTVLLLYCFLHKVKMRHSFIFQNIFLVFSAWFVYKNYIKYITQKFTGNSMQACASESHDTQEQLSDKDREFMHQAYELALKGYNEGGCPIGAILVDEDGTVLGAGHNALVQEGNPIIHGEMAAMRDAGRLDSAAKQQCIHPSARA